MKLYKARNGEENAAGNHVYVFVIASDHNEAEERARGAFDAQSSTDMGYVGLEGLSAPRFLSKMSAKAASARS